MINPQTELFIEELKKDTNVLGVVLFGSWARGNNRPDSDVDLIVLLRVWYERRVEHRGGQAFEIVYISPNAAYEYWAANRDDAAGLWEPAKILYDRDSTVENLRDRMNTLLAKGKTPVEPKEIERWKFNAYDQLGYIESEISKGYPHLARYALYHLVELYTGHFFDIRGLWTPAPKQRFAKIREISPKFHDLLLKFYWDDSKVETGVNLFKKMIPLIFEEE